MNRLTTDDMDFEKMFCAECPYHGEPNGCNFQRWGCDDYGFFVEAARRLKQYEDTGLTPEEITALENPTKKHQTRDGVEAECDDCRKSLK